MMKRSRPPDDDDADATDAAPRAARPPAPAPPPLPSSLLALPNDAPRTVQLARSSLAVYSAVGPATCGRRMLTDEAGQSGPRMTDGGRVPCY